MNKPRPRRWRGTEGQAALELALTLPLLLFIVISVADLGGLLYACMTVSNAARAAAQYAVLGGANADAPIPATAAQITALVANDTVVLPNSASVDTTICENNNGTITQLAGAGTCANVPADPDPTHYVLLSVSVQYTYAPLSPIFDIWQFVAPSGNITRHVEMRVIQ